jgi:glutamate-5-semialdehyde dehydrogenase
MNTPVRLTLRRKNGTLYLCAQPIEAFAALRGAAVPPQWSETDGCRTLLTPGALYELDWSFIPTGDTVLSVGGLALRLDAAAAALIDGTPAGEDDFDTEFLDYILAVRVVADVEEAIAHIAAHSTHHSEAIVTADTAAAARFTAAVDSAAVYVNASTRFTDGGEFGLGCEMGISTQKLHARGPMGLAELTTYKYVITGEGHVR